MYDTHKSYRNKQWISTIPDRPLQLEAITFSIENCHRNEECIYLTNKVPKPNNFEIDNELFVELYIMKLHRNILQNHAYIEETRCYSILIKKHIVDVWDYADKFLSMLFPMSKIRLSQYFQHTIQVILVDRE